MQMVLTGTGTSHGVPVIGCHCKVCQSPNPRDKRLRCSAYITHNGKDGAASHIIIDTGPEFRIQALTYHIEKADCVLLTHSHADHLDGLDDLRVFCHSQSSQHEASPGPGLPVYGNPQTLADTKNRFDYIFKPTQLGGGKPKLDLEDCSRFTPDSPLIIGDVSILPVPMKHGVIDTTGWLMSVNGSDGCRHSIAYLTDCSEIPESSFRILTQNGGIIDHLVIDGLREEPHSTHFSYLQAMEAASKIGAFRTWLTHICHNMDHDGITAYCRNHVSNFPELEDIVRRGGSVLPAYDGLVLKTQE